MEDSISILFQLKRNPFVFYYRIPGRGRVENFVEKGKQGHLKSRPERKNIVVGTHFRGTEQGETGHVKNETTLLQYTYTSIFSFTFKTVEGT